MRMLYIFFIGVLFIILIPNNVVFADITLQEMIEQTPNGKVLQLEKKTYEGNIVIDRSIAIQGVEGTVIRGNGKGNVVAIKAPFVQLENLTVTNSGTDRNSEEEFAAIKIHSNQNKIQHITITDSFHGIYLSQAHNNLISDVNIVGLNNGEIAGQGNGIQVYYSNDNQLIDNEISGTRDGMFFDYSNRNEVIRNTVSHTRYGLHYMYSDDNTFLGNHFNFNTGGAAIMHSRQIMLENNTFTLNQGTRSFGLLLQSSDRITISDNTFAQNQRGLAIDQSTQSVIENNHFYQNQVGVEVWASSDHLQFTKNKFRNNVASVLTLGGQSDHVWSIGKQGNDWGKVIPLLDLNKDGVGDTSVHYKSSLYQLVESNELAYLFLKSPAIKMYEKINSIVNKEDVMVIDEYPLVQQNSGRVLFFSMLLGLLIIGFGSLYFIRSCKR
ncbi:nitrous oxide reductase family maturation protein NosD [Chengkuizengella sediminis]|uniref:nitrous oxide reductase family maturation protein NosD n=1 Tax=Chengkuizengella sediminis TaxID=1885917 RepID=UPI00138A66FA|nr:nitrous oxide reductase family maturation protein NosD [Chengkuizengella sediminis]NDI33902.1 nitrous oxide reductase family maturation protein NosD [Chengkuizengella sediminis]